MSLSNGALCFIDTNIFMYAIGKDHPYLKPSQSLLKKIESFEITAAINVEVLQEILYRYSAIGLEKVGFKLFDHLLDTLDVIWPIETQDLLLARSLQEKFKLKPRDSIHAATMKRYNVLTVYSYDRDFDKIPGIKRCEP